jgi:hypothetical protein
MNTASPQLSRALGFRDLLAFYIVTTFSLRWMATAPRPDRARWSSGSLLPSGCSCRRCSRR